MSAKNYCANHACLRRETCMRFIKSDNPLSDIKEMGEFNNKLPPFSKGTHNIKFVPIRTGRCPNYLRIKVDEG